MLQRPLLFSFMFIPLLAGCHSDGPIAPGGNDAPPAWVDTVGAASVIPGESCLTVCWEEAIELQDPPVQYLLFKDTDDNPFDQPPVIRLNSDPYTFADLGVGSEYWFGVRCQDSAIPPHIDTNNVVISARTADHGWARTWGGPSYDDGCAVSIDQLGNVYVTGSFWRTADFDPGEGVDYHKSNGWGDCYLCKFDSRGNFVWARTWGGILWDWGLSVAVDSMGNVSVTGSFCDSADFDPGSGVDNHKSNSDGSNGYTDAFLSEFDSDGNLIWARTWGGQGDDDAMSVAVDDSGEVRVIGKFMGTVDFDPGAAVDNHSSSGHGTVFLSKFDSSGDFISCRTWSGAGYYFVKSVEVDGSGNVYMTGEFEGTVDFDPGSGVDNHTSNGEDNVFLSRFDPDGNFTWARTWGASFGEGRSVAVDSSGNAYVAGRFCITADFDPGPAIDNHMSNGSYDVFLTKFDSGGNFVWARTWGGIWSDEGLSVVLNASGNPYVVGYFKKTVDFNPGAPVDNSTSNGSAEVFLSKFDSAGNFVWASTLGGTGEDQGESLAVDGSGNAYVTGSFCNIADFDPGTETDYRTSSGHDDIFLIKFLSDGN